MNDIPKAVTAPTPIRTVETSSQVSGVKQQKGGNELPVAAKAEKAATSERGSVKELQEQVEAAVKQMNDYIQSTQRDLHFSYDKSSGETVVKVLDRGTQQVIRQIPDETFLKLARSTGSEGSFQLLNAQA
jgi:flagellar protein FlaG